ncbi:uncharacterized protein BP5553_10454 [Venustampulla echinocandica]|uniref:Deoxyribonuclease NucA/NucB domain-containing protein n=1 Tax=Venustampulla echinocandica TaxID=2656787 RepID=A0A370T9C6_9HELO|nr:uncharacterized protein BP5553_10454 [Venustampulla echinocandica]RDL30176.1 hypothetical protein BP5553_10454 [Venustampulla echinocandica]
MRVAFALVVLPFSGLSKLVFAAPTPGLEAIRQPVNISDAATRTIVARQPVGYDFTCENKPHICKNMCLAALCRDKPGVALAAEGQYQARGSSGSSGGQNKESRKHSGFKFFTTDRGKAAFSASGFQAENDLCTSMDEWPPASTIQGGTAAVLRLVPVIEQYRQGGATATDRTDHFYVLADWSYALTSLSNCKTARIGGTNRPWGAASQKRHTRVFPTLSMEFIESIEFLKRAIKVVPAAIMASQISLDLLEISSGLNREVMGCEMPPFGQASEGQPLSRLALLTFLSLRSTPKPGKVWAYGQETSSNLLTVFQP